MPDPLTDQNLSAKIETAFAFLSLALLGAPWAIRDFHEYLADVEANYLNTFDLAPDLAERMRTGCREERIVGTLTPV